MIYTLTLNPSLDYIVQVDHFKEGTVNRITREEMLAGGKGINVSTVLNTLGAKTCALGFIAGFSGDEIQRQLNEKGIRTDLTRVSRGYSRINLKMKSDLETEINGAGPDISQDELDSLMAKIRNLSEEDMLILSGSISRSLPENIYEMITRTAAAKGIPFIVDAEGDLLQQTIRYRPFLIKPNHHELSAIFHADISSREEAVPYARKLQEAGARNVLVSMAGEGAVLADENGEIWFAQAPKGTVVNSVGAGDSSVAGFLYGYLSSHDYGTALRTAVAAGSASAFSIGLASKEDIRELFEKAEVYHG